MLEIIEEMNTEQTTSLRQTVATPNLLDCKAASSLLGLLNLFPD